MPAPQFGGPPKPIPGTARRIVARDVRSTLEEEGAHADPGVEKCTMNNYFGVIYLCTNFYYIQSVPVINVSTSQIPPYGSSLFAAEEEYAFNVPTNQIDNISEVLKTIDWTCRKQAQLEQPRPYRDRYDSKEAVASRLNIDDVIASANKPPKIRWRQAT